MPTSYTPLLGLALPVTGELAGTWGDVVSDYITKYVDSSVAGTQTISGSQTAVTLTRANGAALSQAGSGATGSSQYQVINCTGNPAGTLTVTIDVSTGSPTLSNSTYSQTFAVINGTSTSQSVVVRATTTSGTSTGTTLVSGEKALIAWNGSDFIKVATSAVDGVSTIAFGTTGLTPSSATSGAVTVAGTLVAANGGTGQSSYTTGDLLYATGSTALSKLGIGTNGQILTSTGTAPQWSTLSGVAVTTFSAGTTGFTPSSATSGAVTLAGTLATTNGGTGLTSFTANGVVYASSSSALTTGSALTFDGTNLSVTSPSTSTTFTLADNGGRLVVLQNSLGASGISQVGTTTNHDFYVRAGAGPAGLNSLYLQAGGVTGYALSYAGASTWYVGGTRSMDLTSTGLGIGTSSPAYKLETVSPAGDYTTALFRSGDTTAANNTGGGFRNNSSATASSRFAQIWLDADGANLSGGDYFFIEKRGNSGTVDFLQYSNAAMRFGTNYTNRATIDLTLDSSGNLGIGTSSPAAKLDIYQSSARYVRAYPSSGLADLEVVTNNNSQPVFAVKGTGTADLIRAYSGSTQVLTLDSSGNLGLGVTPSAWFSVYKPMQLGSYGAAIAGQTNSQSLSLWNNAYPNASNVDTYTTTNAANKFRMDGGAFQFFTAPSGNAGNAISFTQAMTLDASGNLLVGTTVASGKLSIAGSSSDAWSSTTTGGLTLNGVTSGISTISTYADDTSIRIGAGVSQKTGLLINGQSSSGGSFVSFSTGGSERARITSGGVLLVGVTAASSTQVDGVSGGGAAVQGTQSGGGAGVFGVYNAEASSGDNSPPLVLSKAMTTTSSSARFVQFFAGGLATTPMGGIVGNGASNVQFATLSDVREKTNIQPVSGSLDKVVSLRPVSFDWIKSGEHINAGFIAQEVEQVFPEFVVENMANEGEESRKGLTGGMTGGIIAHLVAAIQEQQAIITDLRARVAQLEAK